jgi:hypothetical protein
MHHHIWWEAYFAYGWPVFQGLGGGARQWLAGCLVVRGQYRVDTAIWPRLGRGGRDMAEQWQCRCSAVISCAGDPLKEQAGRDLPSMPPLHASGLVLWLHTLGHTHPQGKASPISQV